MNFKRLLLLFAIFPSFFFTSCSKTAAGSYTYKISGQISAIPTAEINSADEVVPEIFYIESEFGQMNVAKGKNSDKVVVTWDNLLGNVCSTTASLNGCSISLDPGRKTISIYQKLVKVKADVDFKGDGELVDNSLVIPIKYKGEFTYLGNSWTISDSHVECVATANQ